MKKALVLIMAIGLAVALLAITGCGSDSTTIQTPEGEITFEEDEGAYNQKDADGFIKLNALRLKMQAHRRK